MFQDGTGGSPIVCTPRGNVPRAAGGPLQPPQFLSRVPSHRPSQGRQDTGGFPGRSDLHHSRVPAHPGLRRPQQRVATTYCPERSTPAHAGMEPGTPQSGLRGRTCVHPDPADADSLTLPCPASTFEVPPAWLLAVSRTLELSLQSSFQLSLTVLVRYRSRGHI